MIRVWSFLVLVAAALIGCTTPPARVQAPPAAIALANVLVRDNGHLGLRDVYVANGVFHIPLKRVDAVHLFDGAGNVISFHSVGQLLVLDRLPDVLYIERDGSDAVVWRVGGETPPVHRTVLSDSEIEARIEVLERHLLALQEKLKQPSRRMDLKCTIRLGKISREALDCLTLLRGQHVTVTPFGGNDPGSNHPPTGSVMRQVQRQIAKWLPRNGFAAGTYTITQWSDHFSIAPGLIVSGIQ